MNTFFKNKIALVTGAGSGIGLALSEELLKKGCIVYLTDLNYEDVKNIAKTIGGNAIALKLDVTNRVEFKEVIDKIIEQQARIDFLFNNAGIGLSGDTLGYTIDDWDKIIDINLKGSINGTTLIYPLMKNQGSGQIIFTASIAGLVPSGMLVPYATSKHAIIGLARSLRLEAIDYNIRINIICPGTIDTPMLDNSTPATMDKNMSIDTRGYLTSITGEPISPEKLAVKALEGISKNTELIFYPKKAKEIWRLSRFMPRTLHKLARRAITKLRHQPVSR